MKKGKSIALFTIICALLSAILFFTFAQFDVGVKRYNGVLGAIETEYDVSGGQAYTYELTKDNIEEVKDINEVTETVSKRLNALGYEVFNVVCLKNADKDVKDHAIRIEIKAPLTTDGEEDTSLLETDLSIVMSYGEIKLFGDSESEPTTQILEDVKSIENAKYVGEVTLSDGSTGYQMDITFTKEAFEVIKEGIEAGTFYLRIALDDTTLITKSITLSEFSNRTLQLAITSKSGAKQLALQVQGALDYKYELTSSQIISSTYNFDAKLVTIIAVVALFVISTVVFTVKYKGFGLIAGLSFIIYILIYLWLFILIPGVKVSMGSLVGIIISSVLMIDALAVIFTRISEENKKGKTVKFSITSGEGRALKPILSYGVLTTALALTLLIFTKGVIKGFGIALGIGSAVAIFASVVVSKGLIRLVLGMAKNKPQFLGLKSLTEKNGKEDK